MVLKNYMLWVFLSISLILIGCYLLIEILGYLLIGADLKLFSWSVGIVRLSKLHARSESKDPGQNHNGQDAKVVVCQVAR